MSSLPECFRIDKKKTFLNNTINFSSHIIIQDESIISCTLVPVSSCKLIPKKKKKPSLSTYNDLLEIQTLEYDHNSQLFQRELAAMDQQLKKKIASLLKNLTKLYPNHSSTKKKKFS